MLCLGVFVWSYCLAGQQDGLFEVNVIESFWVRDISVFLGSSQTVVLESLSISGKAAIVMRGVWGTVIHLSHPPWESLQSSVLDICLSYLLVCLA